MKIGFNRLKLLHEATDFGSQRVTSKYQRKVDSHYFQTILVAAVPNSGLKRWGVGNLYNTL